MQRITILLFLLLIIILPGYGVVETIFKAGMWWAFFLVALVVGIVVFIASKAGKK